MQGRIVTTTDVLDSYQSDHHSNRSGRFVKDLYHQRVRHEERLVTPENVIAEYDRAPDHDFKCQVGRARFLSFCCLSGIALRGRTVTPDNVATCFPDTPEGKLGLAHFRIQCREKNLRISGVQVSTELIINDLIKLKATLELARFKAECFLRFWNINGRQITYDEVVNSFPDTEPGRRSLARFIEQCYMDSRYVNDQRIIPEKVLASLQADGSLLEQTRFKAHCFFKGTTLNGKRLTPETLCNDYQKASAQLELGRFKAECCLKGHYIHGQPVQIAEVLKSFPATPDGKLGRARFKASCCLNGMLFDDKPIPPASVARDFKTAGDLLGLAHFRQSCCLKGLAIAGVPVTPESVIRDFKAVGAELEIARFEENCCVAGIKINGRAIAAESVIDKFLAINAHLELARFKELCFKHSLPVKGQIISAQEVMNSFPNNRLGRLGRARFRAACFFDHQLIGGKPVCPQSVVNEFRAIGAKLELARFKEDCVVNNQTINGRVVSPDEVVANYKALEAGLELAHFLSICHQRSILLDGQPVYLDTLAKSYQNAGSSAELLNIRTTCCLSAQKLNGKRVTPESVIASFRGRWNEQLNTAQFMAKCCLKGLSINGMRVTAEDVIDQFPDSYVGRQKLAYFQEQCCLKGIFVHGKPVTPEMVLQSFGQFRANTLGAARFIEECCLRGLPLHGKLVSPRMVLNTFSPTQESGVSIARFLEVCFRKGLLLDGRPLTPEEIEARFPANQDGRLGKCHFFGHCCLNQTLLHGKLVTPDAALAGFREINHQSSVASFLIDCYLRKLRVDGRQISASSVLRELPCNHAGRQQLAYFYRQCCLNDLQINGRPVMPEEVAKIYDEEDCLLEKAFFYTELALQARTISGNRLDSNDVLKAFSQAPGDNTTHKVMFLTQQLIALPENGDDAVAIFEKAQQLATGARIKDESNKYQLCVLQFLAMRYALTVNQKPVLPEQVWASIKALRYSFTNICLLFHFLAYCYQSGVLLMEQLVTAQQVLDCLNKLPISKQRQSLTQWFTEIRHSESADVFNHLLRPPPVAGVNKHPKRIEVFIDDLLSTGPFPCYVSEYFDEQPCLTLNAQTLTALKIIQDIGQLCITGSFSRCLQGISTSFNDIDLLGTEAAIITLIARMTSELNDRETDCKIPCRVLAQMLPGCPQLNLPSAFSITVTEGDYGRKLTVLQASIHSPETLNALNSIKIPVTGADCKATCLPFYSEIQLMANTLRHLISQLEPLTAQLLSGNDFPIPRAVLFNFPSRPQERVFALMMRCLLTLNKTRQFCSLLAQRPAIARDPCVTDLQNLKNLGRQLIHQMQGSSCREPFVATLDRWLSIPQQATRKQFVRTLLALMINPAELF